MRRPFALIVALMLVLTFSSGAQPLPAYAGEMGNIAMSVDGTPPGHTAGDADQVPGDADKATPHHHSLGHDHGAALPALDFAAGLPSSLTLPERRASFALPPGFARNRDLRPPIA